MTPRPPPPALLPWALDALGADAHSGSSVQVVAGDASSRRYFRARIDGRSYILAEAPPATEKNEAFLARRDLLEEAGIRVPTLFAADLARGFLLLEDLGDELLLGRLNASSVARYYGDACGILRQLAAVDLAAAALPDYDAPLLSEELGRFPTWFAGELLGCDLDPAEHELCQALFGALQDSALAQPRVLVHRDFHSRNLMLGADGALALIDFQDAVAGPLTYDLVSLLRDCYVRWPAAQVMDWAREHRHALLRSGRADLPAEADFLRAFDWMGLQRHLKVLGTFARLSLRDGKPAYLADLPLVLTYTREILARYAPEEAAFAEFARWFDQRLGPAMAAQPWAGAA